MYQNPVIYIDPNGKQTRFSQRPQFHYDSGFSKFPKEKPTAADRKNFGIWTLKGTVAQGIYPNGAAAYLHYLGNTGSHYTFNLAKYLNNDKSGNTLLKNIAKGNAEKVLDHPGKVRYYSQPFSAHEGSAEFPYPETTDWQKAIGAFNFYYKADLTVSQNKQGGLDYSLDLTLYGEDKYNFNPGQKDISSGTPDAVNGRFEVVGWAKEFMQSGLAKIEKIKWTVPKKLKP